MDGTAKKGALHRHGSKLPVETHPTTIVIGALLGSVWGGGGAEAIGWIGDLFIRLIRMIVVPLVL